MIAREIAHRGLVAQDAGSLLPIGAVAILVLAAMIGGGVDASRAYRAEARLQSACDAGVLAGRKAVALKGFDSVAATEARAYFDNNFDPVEQNATQTVFTPVSPDNGNTVRATASSRVSTVMMNIFGYSTVPISTTCSASMGVGNSDVTMVLDTTGSMGDRLASGGPTKIVMLREAMNNFYDTVQASIAGGNARVRYAFVPYSQSVNVGRLINGVSSSYLVDRMTIQSREPVYTKKVTQVLDHYSDPVETTSTGTSAETIVSQGISGGNRYTTRGNCTSSLPADTAWSNSGAASTDSNTVVNGSNQQVTTNTTTQVQTRNAYTCVMKTSGSIFNLVTYYVPYVTTYQRSQYSYRYQTRNPVYATVETPVFSHMIYKPVSYDVSRYKGFNPVTTPTADDGSNVTSTWDGCIEERETTPAASFSFSRGSGITPISARDLDIDSAPDGTDATKWAPMWPEVAYYRTSFVATGPGRGRYDLANNADSLTGGQAPSACPYRAQLLAPMSKDAFSAYVNALYPDGNTYHDLGILWGARVSSPDGIFANSVNQAPPNGGNVSRHMIFMTDGQMMPSIAIQSSYGIEYHDRRVTANGVNLQAARHTSRFLALCEAVKAKGIRLWVIAFSTGLSDDLEQCASDKSAYTADNADELNRAFQEIAKEVGELRIVQ